MNPEKTEQPIANPQNIAQYINDHSNFEVKEENIKKLNLLFEDDSEGFEVTIDSINTSIEIVFYGKGRWITSLSCVAPKTDSDQLTQDLIFVPGQPENTWEVSLDKALDRLLSKSFQIYEELYAKLCVVHNVVKGLQKEQGIT